MSDAELKHIQKLIEAEEKQKQILEEVKTILLYSVTRAEVDTAAALANLILKYEK